MIKKKVIGYILLVFLALMQLSCFSDQPTLNSQDRKVVDSLYNAERKIQLKLLDSICTATFDKRVASAVDSIMMKRLEEIRRLQEEGQ
jgi:4-hydroxy-3-methylbut-2-enyl diphosphate reductase IspH